MQNDRKYEQLAHAKTNDRPAQPRMQPDSGEKSSPAQLEAASQSLKPPVRPLLPCPYRAWNGVLIKDQAYIDFYNRIQTAINKWLEKGLEPPEELLDSSHRAFVMIVELSALDGA